MGHPLFIIITLSSYPGFSTAILLPVLAVVSPSFSLPAVEGGSSPVRTNGQKLLRNTKDQEKTYFKQIIFFKD